MSMPTGDPELDEFRRLQDEEYGAWVATQNIYVGNALAYPEGGAVPKSNVERHGYDKNGLVESAEDVRKRAEKADAEKRATEDERIAATAAASAEAANVSEAPQDDAGNAADGSKPRKRATKSTSDGE